MKKRILKTSGSKQKGRADRAVDTKQSGQLPGKPEITRRSGQQDSSRLRIYPSQHTEKPW